MPAPKITKTWDYSYPGDDSPTSITITNTEDANLFDVEASFTVWTTSDSDAVSCACQLIDLDDVRVEVKDEFIMNGRHVVARTTVEAKSFNAAHKMVSGVWERALAYRA